MGHFFSNKSKHMEATTTSSSTNSTTTTETKTTTPPPVSSSSLSDPKTLSIALDSFCQDFATFLDQSHLVDPNVKHIEQYTIESLLTRIDEFARLVNLVSNDASRTRELLPPLLEKTSDLEKTFASIDAASSLVDDALMRIKELEDRVSKAERELTSRAYDPRNVVSSRRKATAIGAGLGSGARDDAGKLLMVRGQLSSHPVFDKK